MPNLGNTGGSVLTATASGAGGVSEQDFALHDRLPPEVRVIYHNLRLLWSAQDAWSLLRDGRSAAQIYQYFEGLEFEAMQLEAELTWTLRNGPNLDNPNPSAGWDKVQAQHSKHDNHLLGRRGIPYRMSGLIQDKRKRNPRRNSIKDRWGAAKT